MNPGDSQGEIEDLTRRACAGDREALAQLLVQHLPRLRAFVRLRAGPELRAFEETADLTQSVCCEILERAERFRFPNEAAFRYWLFTNALRKISNHLRDQRAGKRAGGKQVELSSEASDSRPLDPQVLALYASFTTPSVAAAERERAARLEAAFDRLTEEQREVVTLAHLVGLSRAQIAEQLGKSEGAVRVTLHRTLAKLAELLDEDEA